MDVTVKGFALASFGLTDSTHISGLGLETRGFVWPCQTWWIMPTGVTTSWTQPAGVSTIWIGSSNVIYGETC